MIGFLIFGTSGDSVDLGPVDPEDFDVLDLDEPCHLILEYSYFHIFFIFGLVYSKTYILMDRYDDAVELDSGDVEEILEEVPIPFMERFGLLILIAIGIVAGVLL